MNTINISPIKRFFSRFSFFQHLSRLHYLLMLTLACLLPLLLNATGVDFSIENTPVTFIKNQPLTNHDLLSQLTGTLHHTLVEWSAIVLALLGFALAMVHYRLKGDISVAIIGIALLSAASIDAFHTLAAAHLIDTNLDNGDFIPFTWALSRIFNAVIIIIGTLISLWLHKHKIVDNKLRKQYEIKVLLCVGIGFLTLATSTIYLVTINQELPQTIFSDAVFSRPYDLLPLGLFIFSGSLLWSLYRLNRSLAVFAFLISIVAQVATQLHMALGSTALFDNHFNIAHALKVVAYACMFIGMLLDLNTAEKTTVNSNAIEPSLKPNLTNKADGLLAIKKVRSPLSVQIPLAAFVLSISIAILVSFLFYSESKALLLKQGTKELSIEANLVEPIIEQLYEQAQSDVLFLSNTPPINGIINTLDKKDTHNYKLWKSRLEKTFTSFLNAKPYYEKLRYIGVDNEGLELVNVRRRNNGQAVRVPKSQLQKKAGRQYFEETLEKSFGDVYFSKITLNREHGKVSIPHKEILRVATPIYHPLNDTPFGFIVISVDFNYFISQVKAYDMPNLLFYLANEHGDFIYHPDEGKNFASQFGQQYSMQQEFPQLKAAINNNSPSASFTQITLNEQNYSGHYELLSIEKFNNNHPLRLLVLHDNIANEQALADFRVHSILLGCALAIIALGLAVLASRKVATPLSQIITTLENYEQTGSVAELPINSTNEVGVLARNFHNLFAQMKFSLTQQTLMAEAAEQSAKKLNSVLASAADAIVTISANGEIQSFNHAAEKMFGYEQAAIMHKSIYTLIPKDYAQKYNNYIVHYLKTGTPQVLAAGNELQALRKSGQVFPIHLSISATGNNQDSIFIGIVHDISKEKELEQQRDLKEQELKQANARTNLATDSAGIGIWELDFVTQRLTWDLLMFKLYGLSPEDFTGSLSNWSDAVHPEDIKATSAAVEYAIEHRSSFNEEFRIMLPDGTIKFIKAAAVIKCNDLDEPILMTGVNYDISEVKRAELALIQAKELAEDTVRHKTEFLASMSHEIRTPMNGVLGMLGLLTRSNLSPEQHHHVKLATSSAESLLTLINDILDFSKVEAGKLDLEILDFDLHCLLGECTESMALRCQEKGLEIILDVKGVKHSHVKGDPGRIRQILTNLLGNAIKFTDHGEIVIRASVEPFEQQSLKFTCKISDTGIGIAQEKLSTIFDSFTQVDASTTRQYGGTGLGLAISKQLCQLMQGSICVESIEDQGSCFTIELILAQSECANLVIPSVDIEGVEILVVDDNHTNRLVLREQFELWGAKVTEAENGIMALSILEKDQQSKFKVAFLDMQMPYMDGAELGKRIRELPSHKNLKLVMMTSMVSRGDASYFAELGFNAYFPKPTTTSDLFDTLALTISNSESLVQATPLITHQYLQSINTDKRHRSSVLEADEALANLESLQHCRILLVEDNRINQEVARHILAEFGINIDVAADGVEALQSLKLSEQATPYDLILMDCQMPRKDGYQATKEIRAGGGGAKHKNVPIIAMTANAMKGDKEKCLQAGMDDYLSKPISQESLKTKLLLWYKPEAKAALTINQPNNATELINTEEDNNLEEQTASENYIIWDKEALLKRVNQKEEMMQKLLQLFIDEIPTLITAHEQAFSARQYQNMLELTHKIKGIAANVSAIELYKQATSFEKTLHNQDVNSENYQAFLQSYQTVHQYLSDMLKGNAEVE